MRLCFLLSCLLALWGCGAPRHAAGSSDAWNSESDEMPRFGSAPPVAEAKVMRKAAMAVSQSYEGMADMGEIGEVEGIDYQGAAPAEPVAQQAAGGGASPIATPGAQTGRMVYYNGGISLKATSPESVLDTATAQVQKLGGYVESRNPNYAVLRVPVAHFRAFFEAAQTLGVLQNKWMRADDITDAYQDNALRIKIGEATLVRLQELLAASTNDDEKLRLLREIQRVNDELEQRKTRQEILAKQAAFSRLELNVQPFVFETGRLDLGIDAFGWFAELNAVRTQEPRLGKKAKLDVPAGLVKVDSNEFWAARSADGVDFWMFRRTNEPMGSGAFWSEALRNSLAPSFAKVDTFNVGEFAVLRLESFGPQTYVWWIATYSHKKKFYVAEAFFPDLAAEVRHGQSIRQSLAGGVQ